MDVERALGALHDALGKDPDAVLASLDLVLKYAAAKTYARKTTTVSATQVLLRDLLTYLADAGVDLHAKEAALLLPSLLDNAGATREANRLAYRAILDLLPPVMGARAFVRQVLGAVRELSNKRSQAEALRAVGGTLESCASTRFSVKSLVGREGWKVVGGLVAGANAEVRGAALEAARPLWREMGGIGKEVLAVLGPFLGAKGKDIMQGRMKEWSKAEKDPAAVAKQRAREAAGGGAVPAARGAGAGAASSSGAGGSRRRGGGRGGGGGASQAAARRATARRAARAAAAEVEEEEEEATGVQGGGRGEMPTGDGAGAGEMDLSALGQGEQDVSAFLSEIDHWFQQTGMPQEQESEKPKATATGASDAAGRPGVAEGADEEEEIDGTGVDGADGGEEEDEEAAPLAEFPGTPIAVAARRETAVVINSNEIRRAVAGTPPVGGAAARKGGGRGQQRGRASDAPISGAARSSAAAAAAAAASSRTPHGSGGTAGSRDSAMLGSLLGRERQGSHAAGGRETPVGRKAAPRSLLPAPTAAEAAALPAVDATSRPGGAGLPGWLSGLAQDLYSAAYLMDRARKSGKLAAVLDAKRYAAGLTALSTLTTAIREAGQVGKGEG